jgi:hypothetical protein
LLVGNPLSGGVPQVTTRRIDTFELQA